MLSVIIATQNSERALVPTLAALVSGATAGLISEVLIADGGSRDDTAAVADVAGCSFLALDGRSARRLKAAAGKARAPWLLFLRPGTVLDAPWIGRREPLRRATHAAGQRRRVPPRRCRCSRACAMRFRCCAPRSAHGRGPSKAC